MQKALHTAALDVFDGPVSADSMLVRIRRDFFTVEMCTGLVAILTWFHLDQLKWPRLYFLIVTAFLSSRIIKQLLYYPRGFWVARVGSANYCELGYAAPSTYAFVSLVAAGYLVYAFNSHKLLLYGLTLLLFFCISGMMLGLETVLDHLVSWMTGLLLLLAFLQCDMMSRQRGLLGSNAIHLLLLVGVCTMFYAAEQWIHTQTAAVDIDASYVIHAELILWIDSRKLEYGPY